MRTEPMKCLWISRYIPHPMDAGAKVYSGMLAQSLAEAGVTVRLLGFGSLDAVPADSPVEHVAVPSQQRNQLLALLTHLPIAAAIDATRAYRRLLEQQLREPWDAIVLDGYGAGWALERCLEHLRQISRPCVLVHISHNHEAVLWQAMAREARGAWPRRWILWQNSLKVRALERRLVNSVDLLSVITAEDAATLGQHLPKQRVVTLTPGYAGYSAPARTIEPATPRRVLLVGSFRWVMKQENLTRFVQLADPVFHEAGIELDVVGDVPEELLAHLRSECRATHFHGFVDDVAPFLARARLAVVPEVIGGGFKLKFLDYFFGRVPVITLSAAAAGLPPVLRESMLSCSDLAAMVAGILINIGDLALLNQLQQRAWQASAKLFRWRDRGELLRQAIIEARQLRAGSAVRGSQPIAAAARPSS